jgi:hydrogenase maturation protein HypF
LIIRADIHVTGIVQGVGFRPFVYRVAKSLGLNGYVLNLGDAGVKIVVEGERKVIDGLILQVKENPPSISRIEILDVEWGNESEEFDDFVIAKSNTSRGDKAVPILPPDIAMCDDCKNDLFDPSSRWFEYPFTSCAACGPRFSTITDLPYDRPYTTMVDFPLCSTCNTGYTSPLDRRYHAQTTACATCGPTYQLVDATGSILSTSNPVVSAADLLSKGSIVALHGIGGTHIVTQTTDVRPIRKLRERKRRQYRPFAVMVRDLGSLRNIANPTKPEMDLISSWRRPIVLVRKRLDNRATDIIPEESFEEISPGLDTVGVMMPYAPLHHLLFNELDESTLVMTSANPTGVPMYVDPGVITHELSGIVDYYLIHNRRIHQRVDDSVLKLVDGASPTFIRRSRGYVPEPLQMAEPWNGISVMAVGPELKATGAILRTGNVYMTQHIGDTDRIESIEFLSHALNHLIGLLGVKSIDAVACDLHPEFLSTEFAETFVGERDIPLFRVQHHHAHLAAILVDHKLESNTSIVCITSDGYGYGPDGNGWGGEVLVGNSIGFKRAGGLESHVIPGGDLSAKYAARPAIALLEDHLKPETLLTLLEGTRLSKSSALTEESLSFLLKARDTMTNIVRTSSTGRVLDAMAAVLGVCSENSYDGECPMKLEAVSRDTDLRIKADFIDNENGAGDLDTSQSLLGLVDLLKQGAKRSELAYAAQWHIGEALAEVACRAANQEGIEYVGFSGGVALNRIITKSILNKLAEHGLKPLLHQRIPPGDGGISSGQIMVAAGLLSK